MSRALPFLVALSLAVYAVIDCAQTPGSDTRGLRKPLWLLVIVAVPIAGPIAWVVAGRPRRETRRSRRTPIPAPAPDDDPEFLRQIRNLDEEHEDLLTTWEKDLRRREKNLGGRPASPADPRPPAAPPVAPPADPPAGEAGHNPVPGAGDKGDEGDPTPV